MSRILRYPHLAGPLARLPDCFKKQWLAIHRVKHLDHLSLNPHIVDKSISLPYYTPGFSYDIPPKAIHPPEADRCLWNGDAILSGYVRKNEKSQIHPKFWSPKLYQQMFFSEILNRWMTLIVSESALLEIERLGSLDVYILSTPLERLGSRLGSHLKRDMLLKLCDLSESSNSEMAGLVANYAKFLVPREEAEWTGLTLEEAVKKQLKLEYEAQRRQVRPLKYALVDQALDEPDSESRRTPDDSPSPDKAPKRLLNRFFSRGN